VNCPNFWWRAWSVRAWRRLGGASISDRVTAIKDADWVDFEWQDSSTGTIDSKTDHVIRGGEYLVGSPHVRAVIRPTRSSSIVTGLR
jgi:hypothetical protein